MAQIDDLLNAMTLAEKLGQLTMTAVNYGASGPFVGADLAAAVRTGDVGGLLNLFGAARIREIQRVAVEDTRLKIPLLIGLDVLHGYEILFPVPLGEAAIFDPALWEETAAEAAKEAAADGINVTFAPMLDIARDPRWGRGVEGPGEDATVAACFAHAKVRGFQGSTLVERIAATAKHYCAYGAVTAGREYASVDLSERTLEEIYLAPFAAAVEAGVTLVMPAFTDLAGVPMTANREMLTGILRERLGFSGVIVSDDRAIAQLIRQGIAADLAEAAALALKAGVDIDMMSNAYHGALPIALDRGLVTIDEIDAAVRRVLRLKESLGLFVDPYRRGAKPDDARAKRRALARDVGARSLVLLKNEGAALPLAQTFRRLALIGPLAESSSDMRGPWHAAARAEAPVTVLAGMREALPHTEIVSARGVGIEDSDLSGIAAAVDHVSKVDAILLCLGESAALSGEAASRADPCLPGRQRALAEAVFDAAQAHKKPVIVILFCGRPLIVPWLFARADAVLAAWFPGSEAGHAIADVLSGAVSPSGRTPVSWPRAVGQIPIFFGERPPGRPANPKERFTSRYLDVETSPLFAFGHGLSYGRFIVSNLNVAPAVISQADSIEVAVDVANDGTRAAEETVFCFVHDKIASVARPELELKAFGKIALRPGERGTLRLSFPARDLRFLGRDLKPCFEPGDVDILVGPCADREQLLTATVTLIAEGDGPP